MIYAYFDLRVVFGKRLSFYDELKNLRKSEQAEIYWLDPSISVSNCAGNARNMARWDLTRAVGLRTDHQGKCCVFYVPTFRAAYEEYLSLSNAERRGYASRKHELVLKIKEVSSILISRLDPADREAGSTRSQLQIG